MLRLAVCSGRMDDLLHNEGEKNEPFPSGPAVKGRSNPTLLRAGMPRCRICLASIIAKPRQSTRRRFCIGRGTIDGAGSTTESFWSVIFMVSSPAPRSAGSDSPRSSVAVVGSKEDRR
jgi:hypothetical protein